MSPMPSSVLFRAVSALSLSAAMFAMPALAQQAEDLGKPVPKTSEQLKDPKTANVTVVGHVLKPMAVEPTPERVANLKAPEGFSVTVFAENLVNPRMIAVAGDGTVYVTRRKVGDVVMLRDANGDGVADESENERKVVANRPMMHGIEIAGDDVYLTTVADVYRTKRRADGTFEPLERIISDLPAGGQHPNRMVKLGPDGKLYISVGSTCNACGETDPEHATMVRAEPDGSTRAIFASGLRNTIGYGFEPETGELFGMDHGIDWLGDNEQHEELNHIVQGKKYGWPYIYADGKANPQDEPPGGITMDEWRETSQEPVGLYTPHAAPMQLAFYTGDAFPEEYRGDAFIAMRGSWNRKPPSGFEVLRIRFENGKPAGFEPFVTGFLIEDEASPSGWSQMGRLAGLAQGPDGALYFSDDANGVIYRVAYEGETAQASTGASTQATTGASAGGAKPTVTNEAGADVRMTGNEVAQPTKPMEGLAKSMVEAKEGPIAVTSAAFESGQPIPETFSKAGENISPPIDWGEGPQGTRSFAIIVDDPDAPVPNPPFTHWVAWNLPADVTKLPEGVPGAPKLSKPDGTLQGANDAGSTGWTGMAPPPGDPAHSYHFQVFALDTMLDVAPGASRAEVIEAMKGHVLSVGELVGTYELPARNASN